MKHASVPNRGGVTDMKAATHVHVVGVFCFFSVGNRFTLIR
jgi:hypothetical protein